MRKAIGHLPYITIIVHLPRALRLSVMNTELHEATDSMPRLQAMFESKPGFYLHSIEMQLAGYSAASWN